MQVVNQVNKKTRWVGGRFCKKVALVLLVAFVPFVIEYNLYKTSKRRCEIIQEAIVLSCKSILDHCTRFVACEKDEVCDCVNILKRSCGEDAECIDIVGRAKNICK